MPALWSGLQWRRYGAGYADRTGSATRVPLGTMGSILAAGDPGVFPEASRVLDALEIVLVSFYTLLLPEPWHVTNASLPVTPDYWNFPT